MKNKLSVVLAVHNEAKNLARCLDSVRSFADEIIIVDGQSTDNTVKIAQRYHAKVIKTTNKLNFHINKQMGLDQAQFPLVLQLDADEVVDAQLKAFIVQLKKDPHLLEPNRPVAWWLRRKNLFLNTWLKKGGQYPDPVIRLYLRGHARLPQKNVHEQMVVNGQLATAAGHLLHYSSPTFADYLRKFNTYSSFIAQNWYDQGQTANWFFGLKNYLFQPVKIFISLYFRHKGFVDGQAGFVFALMSGLIYPIAYLKLWELYAKKNQR